MGDSQPQQQLLLEGDVRAVLHPAAVCLGEEPGHEVQRLADTQLERLPTAVEPLTLQWHQGG